MNNNGTGPHVLILEDDNSLRDLFSEALEFETSIASNGAEGIQMFDEVNPDLVLLDLLMPKMDGWEALERVRNISECPVIIVTGQGTTEDIIHGLLEAGAEDYLVKPFGIKELIARVNFVLRRATPAA